MEQTRRRDEVQGGAWRRRRPKTQAQGDNTEAKGCCARRQAGGAGGGHDGRRGVAIARCRMPRIPRTHARRKNGRGLKARLVFCMHGSVFVAVFVAWRFLFVSAVFFF